LAPDLGSNQGPAAYSCLGPVPRAISPRYRWGYAFPRIPNSWGTPLRIGSVSRAPRLAGQRVGGEVCLWTWNPGDV